MNEFLRDYQKAKDLTDIFELVKAAVRLTTGHSRAGLELGLAELGVEKEGFLGAYHPMGSNEIIMNKTPLKRLSKSKPTLYKPYVFMVLLHEYLHSLGHFDEKTVRTQTKTIAKKLFGTNHTVTKMAKDVTKYLPNLVYPEGELEIVAEVEYVKGFDRSSIDHYIG